MLFKIVCFILISFHYTFILKAQINDTLQWVKPENLRFKRGNSGKINFCLENYCQRQQIGYFSFRLFNPRNKVPVDGWFLNVFPDFYFTILPTKKKICQEFSFTIPDTYQENWVKAQIKYTLPTRQDSLEIKIQIYNSNLKAH